MSVFRCNQLGLRSVVAFDMDVPNGVVGIIGNTEQGRKLFLMDNSFATIHSSESTDASEIHFCRSGGYAITNGYSPSLYCITDGGVTRVDLKFLSEGVNVFNAYFLGTEAITLFLSSGQIVVASVPDFRLLAKCTVHCDAITDQWIDDEQIFIATWRQLGIDCCYSIINVVTGESVFSSWRYRSEPTLLKDKDLLIADAFVPYANARVERYRESETLLTLPFRDDHFNAVRRGLGGDIVLHEQLNSRSWHTERDVAVWNITTLEKILQFTAGTGMGTLCCADLRVATLELGSSEAAVKIRSITDEHTLIELHVPQIWRYIHCPQGDDHLVLADDQPGSIERLGFIDVRSVCESEL